MIKRIEAKPKLWSLDDESIIAPPDTATVTGEHKTILYTPDGKALVRKVGF